VHAMRHCSTIFVLALASASYAGAQDAAGSSTWADSARREIEVANAQGDRARLAGAVATLDRALTVVPNDPLLLYYKGYALYRESGVLTGMGKEKEARAELEEADRLLERSNKVKPTADAHALRSAVIGQMIGVSGNPLAGMRLGPRANAEMERAEELGPKNPRVWLLKGLSAIFTPGMFGGGLDKAELNLNKAIELYATDRPTSPEPSWGHADAYVWLGQVRERQKKPDEARAAYQRALEIEPDYAWVKRVLLPGLDRASR
jgi:tetratricopeptide (TPR) repeat protein